MGVWRPTDQIFKEVEDEFGEPFVDVVRQFAEDGESKFSTSNILGVSNTWFYSWLRQHPEKFNWAPPMKSNARREADKARGQSARHKAASAKNMRIGTARNIERFNRQREEHRDLTLKAIELNRQGVGWRRIPELLGVDLDPSTIARRARREFGYIAGDKTWQLPS